MTDADFFVSTLVTLMNVLIFIIVSELYSWQKNLHGGEASFLSKVILGITGVIALVSVLVWTTVLIIGSGIY